MNFLEGRMTAAEQGARFVAEGGVSLRLSAVLSDRLRPGQGLTLGIRPEHVLGEGEGDSSVELTVRAVEPLGPHTLMVGEVAGTPFTAQVGAYAKIEPEQTVRVMLDPDRLHLFDAGSGRAL